MKKPVLIFIVIILFIFIAGCSDFTKPSKSPSTQVTPTSTQPLPPKYTMGDLVKSNSVENVGKIILDYDLSRRKYTVRTVFFDEFGRIYYIKEQKEQSVPFETIETSYPLKTANIDNTYRISEISFPKPKYAVGSIHREEENKNNGIIILSFDYSTDEYIYAYAYYKGGGIWDYDKDAKHTGARGAIEDQYNK